MTPCDDCQASRETSGHWPYFNPACKYCGARCIQRIPRFCGTDAEATQRRRAVLVDWLLHGHDETEIRELAKQKTLAYEPVGGKRKAGGVGASC